MIDGREVGEWIRTAVMRQVAGANTVTQYRQPLVGFAAADDPCFRQLAEVHCPGHLAPEDLLSGARSVISFFLPFASSVVDANAEHRTDVASEWALAYIETNAFIGRIADHLQAVLAAEGVLSAAEPATHNFDPVSLRSRWSHKSVAVIAGLGSFGVHHMVITDAGCAGRFGSLVVDTDLPAGPTGKRNRCLYYADGSCLECVLRCPVNALDVEGSLDKPTCYRRLLGVSEAFKSLGLADVCGKCAIGPCSLGSPVDTALSR
jgi:epoxyqueuosine reductase QueG